MQTIGVHNGNNAQNHSPHDCATDAVTRVSLAPRHDNKAKPDNQLNCCLRRRVDARDYIATKPESTDVIGVTVCD